MSKSTRSDLGHIGDVIERCLATLDGPRDLEAFRRLPQFMQDGAMLGLRLQVERDRDNEVRRAA
jgi:hypothetical protein